MVHGNAQTLDENLAEIIHDDIVLKSVPPDYKNRHGFKHLLVDFRVTQFMEMLGKESTQWGGKGDVRKGVVRPLTYKWKNIGEIVGAEGLHYFVQSVIITDAITVHMDPVPHIDFVWMETPGKLVYEGLHAAIRSTNDCFLSDPIGHIFPFDPHNTRPVRRTGISRSIIFDMKTLVMLTGCHFPPANWAAIVVTTKAAMLQYDTLRDAQIDYAQYVGMLGKEYDEVMNKDRQSPITDTIGKPIHAAMFKFLRNVYKELEEPIGDKIPKDSSEVPREPGKKGSFTKDVYSFRTPSPEDTWEAASAAQVEGKVKTERAGRAERFDPARSPEDATAAQVEAKFWEFSQYLEEVADRTGKYPWHHVGYLLISLLVNDYAKTVRYGPGSPNPNTSKYMATLRSRLTKGLVRVEDTNYLLDMEKNGTFETTKGERAVYWEQLIGRVQASTRRLSAKLRGEMISGMAKMIRDWEAEDDS